MLVYVIYINGIADFNVASNSALNIFERATIALNQQNLKHICL